MSAAPDTAPWGLGAVVVAFLTGMFVALTAGSIAVAAGAGTTDAVTNTVTFLGEWVGFAGVPAWLSRNRGSGSMADDFGLRLGGPADVALGVAAGVAVYGLVGAYTVLLRQFDHANLGHEAQQLSGHGLGAGFFVFAFVAAIGAPFAEEIFFRGLTQPAIQRHIGGGAGLVATALLFGLAHLSGNPVEAVPALAFVGLVLGALAWRTGRLGPGIAAHITFNGITVIAIAASR